VWAGIISVTGLAVTFWAAFWPEPYRMAVLACLLVPLAAVVAVCVSDRRIRLIDSLRRGRTSVTLAFGGPIVALLMRGLDFKLMDLQRVLVPVAVLTGTLTLVIWRIARDPNDRVWKQHPLVLRQTVTTAGRPGWPSRPSVRRTAGLARRGAGSSP
jgi:hypothetical protein